MLLRNLYDTVFRTYVRRDLSCWEHNPAPHPVIYGMYHIFCAPGWQDLVSLQMEHLRHSGLLAETKTLFVSCITQQPEDETRLRDLIPDSYVQLISVCSDARAYEFPALDYMRRKCEEDECYFYYFHTKGVSFCNYAGTHDRRFVRFKRNVEAWRNMMEYFLMDKWDVAVNILNEGYDVYGCYRIPPIRGQFAMFAGNFWWGKSVYIRKLPIITDTMKADRFQAENWLYTEHPLDFSTFDTRPMLYRVNLPSSLYLDEKPPLSDRVHFVLAFNHTKILKKVFHYDYVKHNNKRFQKL